MRPNETNVTKVKTKEGNGNQNYQTKSDLIGVHQNQPRSIKTNKESHIKIHQGQPC